jgi:hypothetical protein
MKLTHLAAFCMLACLAATAKTARAQWDAETLLTSSGGDIWGEGIAAAGTTVHVVYGTGEIRYRRSTDEGSIWTDETFVGSGTIHLTDPIIADGEDVWVVYLSDIQIASDWCCARDMGSISLRHSGDGGVTWEAPVQLSSPSTAFRLSLAYAANRLHLVWMDYRSGAWDTYYRRSPDRGATWEPEIRVAQSMGPFGAERPQVAARGDSVHVTIWDDRANNPACTPGSFTFPSCPDVFHMRSLDGGQTWGAMTNVANGGAYFAGRNDIAVAGASNVIINFNVDVRGETGSKLFAVASSDDGATWGNPTRLTFSPNASDHGSIVGAGDNAYLVWHDDRDSTNREIFYRQTGDGGSSWDPEEQVSSGAPGDSSTPLDAVTSNYVHVVWIDNRGGAYQVYYRRRAAPPSMTGSGGGSADGATTGGGGIATGGGATSGNAGSGPSGAGGGATTSSFGAGAQTSSHATDADGDSSGCGCRVQAARGLDARYVVALALCALAGGRRRRRSRSPSAKATRLSRRR